MKKEAMNLAEIVEDLLYRKQEGGYWDFKEAHHENKADLLHDIICMANNLCDCDAYIVYGVKDGALEIVGVESSTTRRDQKEIVNQLKDKKFFGGVRPAIELKTVRLAGQELDVLIIKNTTNTPYSIVEDFRDRDRNVRANSIYTRIVDINTDIDKTADIDKVERLWRKRFGIAKTPLERLYMFLDESSENWIYETGWPHCHKHFPEFRIDYDGAGQPDNDAYRYFYLDKNASWQHYKIYYHSTVLFKSSLVHLDGTRTTITAPTTASLRIDGNDVWYYCFFKDSINWKVLRLMKPKENEMRRLLGYGYRAFLVFDNELSQKQFELYVENNVARYKGITITAPNFTNAIDYARQQGERPEFTENMARLYEMYLLWKAEVAHEASI